nr:immunoglobulin heavy chain junction region [Mus musculus]MBK4188863.1 immunoglobulin heavy chain junction region [Mus musculus]MBK4188864.1 immunoglobulin heavy chain junction region [Mus musculus]
CARSITTVYYYAMDYW